MIDPVDMAARYAAAARTCSDPVPCGWCLWRAGYRKGRRPRLPRFRAGPATGPDLFTQPDPAAPGTNERGNMSDTTLWHVHFDNADVTTSTAPTKRRAIEDVAARLGYGGGMRACYVWRTADGRPMGAATRETVALTVTVRAEIVRGTATDATGEDAS